MKTCSKCLAVFDGERCKPCRNVYLRERYSKRVEKEAEYRKAYNLENHEKKLAYQKKYRAENKDVVTKSTMNWQKKNPDKVSAAVKKYYEKNKETLLVKNRERKVLNRNAVLLYAKEYAKNNPEVKRRSEHKRRALKLCIPGNLSKGLIERLSILQRGKCICCRKDLKKTKVHMDHIMPLARGGLNVDKNIQLLCQECNLQKHAKHPVEFMQSRGFLL